MIHTRTALLCATAALVTLGMSGCAGEAKDDPSSEPPTAPSVLPDPDLKAGESGIRLDITDCDGCQVKFQTAPKDRLLWESDWYSVDIGSQWIVVPTKWTQGMSVALTTPAAPLPAGEQYNVVFNYVGQTVFDQVDAGRVGTDFTEGYGCWVGTTQRKVAMALQINYVKDDQGDVVAQVYTQLGANAYGQPVPTPNGSLASNGFFSCKG